MSQSSHAFIKLIKHTEAILYISTFVHEECSKLILKGFQNQIGIELKKKVNIELKEDYAITVGKIYTIYCDTKNLLIFKHRKELIFTIPLADPECFSKIESKLHRIL